MKKPLLILVLLISFSSFSQVANVCSSAPQICSGDQFILGTGASPSPVIPPYGGVSNPNTTPSGINSGCLAGGELNPIWFVITIENTGLLEFGMNTSSSVGYIDWIMWPYDALTCDQIPTDTFPPIACNMNASSAGSSGMASQANVPAGVSSGNYQPPISVTAGEQYVICVSNFSSQLGTVTLTGLGAQVLCQSTASLNAELFDPSVQLMNSPSYISLSGMNDTFNATIVDLQGRIVSKNVNIHSNAKINTHNLKSAVYMLFVETEKGVRSFKFYKN